MNLDLDHFRYRVLQDAMAEATAAYWLRRAEVFESVGTEGCDQTAQACRNIAALAEMPDHDPDAIIAEHIGGRCRQ